MQRPDVIQIDKVSKKFTVHKDKSLKERIVNASRSREHAEEYWALKEVGFTVAAGESIGLAGANGSGKSTLLKVIGGILTPNGGEVRTRGRVAALLELGAGFHPDLTGRENIYLNASVLGLTEEEIDKQFDSIVEFSGIADFIDTQVKFYSSGMYVRLAFSVAVHSDPDILLVDEVLAVGDEPFQRKCMEKIREFQNEGRSIILVSHSAEQIIDVCDRAVVLSQGRIIAIGEVRDAMSRLHQSYEKQIRQDIDDAEAKIEILDGAHERLCSITNVEVAEGLIQQADGLKVLISGDTIDVAVDVVVSSPLEGYGILLDIETLKDESIFGMSSRRLQLKLPPIEHTGRITVRLPHLDLGEGDYSFNVAVTNAAGVEMDRKRHCALMTVRSDGMTSGYVKAFPEVLVGPVPA